MIRKGFKMHLYPGMAKTNPDNSPVSTDLALVFHLN